MRKQIELFFQDHDNPSYEIIDDKEWVVNVEGSLHIVQSDLDEKGNLWFKIGKLTGNLYFHGKHFNPSLIPADMGGEVIIVPDEGEHIGNSTSAGNNEEDELGMGYLSANPKSYNKVKSTLEDALTESITNGLGLEDEIGSIIEKIKRECKNKNKYQLEVKFKEKVNEYGGIPKYTGLYDCRIYVDNSNKELKLTAIEKAVYLTFMLYENGIRPEYLTPKFFERLRGIYKHLTDTVQDRSDTSTGVLVKEFDAKTLNGYRSKIREAIKAYISNKKIVDLFAIEGYKDQPFKIEKATDKIRDDIKNTFGVQ
ncbi:MAG: hypothetical protein NC548_48305 [Lachnospiraceae bacterium]|nr:hypothetical protein [Lachnospiraceae bacterium]